MRRRLRNAALAVVLLAGVVSNASAVPIRVDFTGTVFSSYRFDLNGFATQDPTYLGQAVAGWLLIETEGLQRSTATNAGYDTLSFNDLATDPEWVTSSLTIGGSAFDVGLYGLDTGGIRYIDSNGPVSCGPGCSSATPDQFGFTDASSQLILGPGVPWPAPGSYFGRSLTLNSAAWLDPLRPFEHVEYIDLSQGFDALSSVSVPIDLTRFRSVVGSYGESVLTCTVQSCRGTQSLSLAFDITSLSRQIVSVSEPATLSLAALAVFCLAAMSRRRRKQ